MRRIDFRHVIESLRRKPRALLCAQLQDDLLPGENWRQLWRALLAALPPDEAAKVMVEALHIAAKSDDLAGVERYLRRQLRGGELSLSSLRDHYGLRPPRGLAAMPQLQIPEQTLSSYDEFLGRTTEPASATALPTLLKQLKLAQFRSQWQAAEQQAQADGWSPASYLYVLAEQEHQQRHQARLRRLLHEAQLTPVPKTLADIDWGAFLDLDRYQIEQLAHDTGWVDRSENLLVFGPSGVGKTHLAAGICRSLIGLDRSARFFTATTLVQELQRAKADYALAKALNRLDRYALLVIDDIGYVRSICCSSGIR